MTPQRPAPAIDAALAQAARQLRLRDLLLLDAIARHGTLQGAAAELHVSQPAVSQALRAMERALRVRLAERSTRGATLTPAGAMLRSHLLAAGRGLDAAIRRLDAPQPLPLLRLGAIPFVPIGALPAVLASLDPDRCGFRLTVMTGPVDRLFAALDDGEIDCVVSRLPETRAAGTPVPALRIDPVGTIVNAIAAAPRHPLARARPPSIAALARAAWVLPERGSLVRVMFDDLFGRAGLVAPEPWIVSSAFSDNLQLAAAGRLLTIAPVEAIARARPAMRVLLAPPHWRAALVLAAPAHLADWPPIVRLRAAFAGVAEAAGGQRRLPA
ncbi:MAG: LysR family transcriptional regulator [Lautropia sp.]